MTLPDLKRLPQLLGLPLVTLLARFRELGFTRSAVAPYTGICEKHALSLRAPLRNWHLRRAPSPLNTLLRMFTFMDPVTRPEALEAIGAESLLESLLQSGLLVERSEGVVCPWFLNFVNDVPFLSDDLSLGGEAVMGAGSTTGGLIQAAWPLQKVDRLLDLGCGAGTAALLLAQQAEQAVAVDINPRAIELARFNQALANCENVEFRQGDRYAPVAQEKFDLIVSQPPFVSLPEDTRSATYLHGGNRGTEIGLSMLAEAPQHLTTQGRAVFLLDWPSKAGDTPTETLRSTLGQAQCDLLVLLSTTKNLDEYVLSYAVAANPQLGAAYEKQALAHREHLHRLGVEDLRLTLVIVRATDKAPWTSCVQCRSFLQTDPTSAQIERLIRAQDLLNGPEAAFLEAHLVIPEGTRFVQGETGQIRIELPDSRLIDPILCGKPAADLLGLVHQSASVGHAIQAAAEKFRVPVEAAHGPISKGVRDALASGLLELPLEF